MYIPLSLHICTYTLHGSRTELPLFFFCSFCMYRLSSSRICCCYFDVIVISYVCISFHVICIYVLCYHFVYVCMFFLLYVMFCLFSFLLGQSFRVSDAQPIPRPPGAARIGHGGVCMYVCTCTYIHIYIYINMNTYIYIYIYM